MTGPGGFSEVERARQVEKKLQFVQIHGICRSMRVPVLREMQHCIVKITLYSTITLWHNDRYEVPWYGNQIYQVKGD